MSPIQKLQVSNIKRKVISSLLGSLVLITIYSIYFYDQLVKLPESLAGLNIIFPMSMSILFGLSAFRFILFLRSKSEGGQKIFFSFPVVVTASTAVWTLFLVFQEVIIGNQKNSDRLDLTFVNLLILTGLFLSIPQNLRFFKNYFLANLLLINLATLFLISQFVYNVQSLVVSCALLGIINFLVIVQSFHDWSNELLAFSKDQELQEIIDCFPGAVLDFHNGICRRINKYGQQIFLDGDVQVSSHSFTDQKELIAELSQKIRDFKKEDSEKMLFEKLVITREGQRMHLFVLTKASTGSVVTVALDVHDLKTAKDAVAVQTKLALDKSRLATLGLMSAGIAHEISNPLSLIGMIAETSASNFHGVLNNPEMAKAKFQKIAITVQRTSKIISSLKNMARSHENSHEESILIKDLLSDVTELLADKLRESKVHLEIDCIEMNEKIVCRPTEICQVLINAIQNSIQAIENLEERWIRVHIYKSAEQILQLEIIDSGQGIPEEIRSKLAEPLFTTKGYGKGTGLGLTLSNQIMKNHGGQLFFDYGRKNTTLVLQLPLKFS